MRLEAMAGPGQLPTFVNDRFGAANRFDVTKPGSGHSPSTEISVVRRLEFDPI